MRFCNARAIPRPACRIYRGAVVDDDRDGARSELFDGFLRKPIELESLLALLHES
jgi:hypothetical protein